MEFNFSFPNRRPDQSPSELWALQNELLRLAELELGPRASTKKVYQPTFSQCGPILINTPNFDGSFAELGQNAAGYWPTAVYELAHETVHLLDPKAGYGTWLEEGIAVAFSVECSALTCHAMAPNSGPYLEALELVKSLPGTPMAAGKTVRERFGNLFTIAPAGLRELFPMADEQTLVKLCETCVPR